MAIAGKRTGVLTYLTTNCYSNEFLSYREAYGKSLIGFYPTTNITHMERHCECL